jgi:hypothetical protein
MRDIAIIYLTHDALDSEIANFCRQKLLEAAEDLPIISVSQTPLDFGLNVCVGDIGRSWRSIYVQLCAGLQATNARYVAVAEHDCLYTHEHFLHTPLDPGCFDYNRNCWLVQWKSTRKDLEGMYSYWPKRIAMSQTVCWRESLLQAVSERLFLVDAGLHGFRWASEMGMMSLETWKGMKDYAKWFGSGSAQRHSKFATSEHAVHLEKYIEGHVTKWSHSIFSTIYPNLDIRHGSNFTGPKRGKKRCYEIPYWGKWSNVINNPLEKLCSCLHTFSNHEDKCKYCECKDFKEMNLKEMEIINA